MKSNTYLKDESILTLLALNNLIVPEIQRDYVWGENEEVLCKFISDIKKYAKECDACKRVYSEKNNNIGFLYSYKPPYQEIERGRYLDEFLIDGQQRITTVFLLLLSRAVAENRIRDFQNICRVREDGHAECFNYKVREISQNFLDNLLKHVFDIGNDTALDFIYNGDRPSWFLSDFEQDPTATAICKSLKIIRESFKNDDHMYFDFLLENIHFWHFKTEITTQGEELYISMNSTGEQLSDNEKKKAEIMSKENTANFGSKWEEWQHFFWKRRGTNENADKGFNQFLLCVEGLEDFLKSENLSNSAEKGVDVETVEYYMKALFYLFDKELNDYFIFKYSETTKWFGTIKEEIINLLNNVETEWILTPQDSKRYDNQGVSRNRAVLMWSWLYFFKLKFENTKDKDVIPKDDLFRLLHLMYLKYHAYNRSVKTILKLMESFADKGYSEVFNDADMDCEEKILTEEDSMLEILYKKMENDRDELERIIWQIQDIDCIRDARDVGGYTIKEFIDIIEDGDTTTTLQIQNAESLLNNLTKLLPSEQHIQDLEPLVKSCLLLYGEFWRKVSPWYYNRYNISDWKRIFRTQAFVDFYKEIFKKGKYDSTTMSDEVEKIIKEKKSIFKKKLDVNSRHDDRTLAIIYDMVAENKDVLWSNSYLGFWQDNNNASNRIMEEDPNCFSMVGDARSDYVLIRLPDNWQQQFCSD